MDQIFASARGPITERGGAIREEQRWQDLLDCPDSCVTVTPNNANLLDKLGGFFDKNMSVECPYIPSTLMFVLHKRQ